jgi:hypothetical protein
MNPGMITTTSCRLANQAASQLSKTSTTTTHKSSKAFQCKKKLMTGILNTSSSSFPPGSPITSSDLNLFTHNKKNKKTILFKSVTVIITQNNKQAINLQYVLCMTFTMTVLILMIMGK